MRSKVISLVIFLICGTILNCSAKNQYYFRHFDTGDGLSQNTVLKILQDSQGFLWFATKDGLNRFDGIKFRKIEINENQSNGNFISSVFEDSSGKIWIGTQFGPAFYNPLNEKVEWLGGGVLDEDGNEHSKYWNGDVKDFAETSDGHIIFYVENEGMYSYEPKTKKLNRLPELPGDEILSVTKLFSASNGKVYIGSVGGGLYETEPDFIKVRAVTNEDGTKYFNHAIIASINERDGRLYVATDNMGVHTLDLKTGKLEPFFVFDEMGKTPILSALDFIDDKIYIGSERGLYVFDLESKKFETHLRHNYFDRFSLSDDAIYSILADRDGGLWIGSYFGGIDYKSPSRLQLAKYMKNETPGSLQSERIRALVEDAEGIIYIGSEDKGLSKFNPATNLFSEVEGIENNNIKTLAIDGNDLWVGTFGEGIVIRNLKTGNQKRIFYSSNDSESLISDYIFTIHIGSSGREVFIGTWSGAQIYNKETGSLSNIPELNGQLVFNITEDNKGNIWFATFHNGLYRYNKLSGKWQSYLADSENENSIPSNKVFGLNVDLQGNLWIKTQNGLRIFNHEKDEFTNKLEGIDKVGAIVYEILEDEYGRYWLSSNHGVFLVDEKGFLRNFTISDGLSTNQFNYNAGLSAKDGRFYFGSMEGMIAFDPNSYLHCCYDKEIINKPVISELFINGKLIKPGDPGSPLEKSISMTEEIILDQGQNHIAFRLADLEFGNPNAQAISYRLLGESDEWIAVNSGSRVVTFPDLKPGEYTFEAVVTGLDNEIKGEPMRLKIIVKTPFFKSPIAIILYIILGLATVVTFIYFYIKLRRLSLQRLLEQHKHKKEKEVLDAQIDLFTNVAHEIRTPLSLIKAPLDNVFNQKETSGNPKIKADLNIINRNVDRLLILADQLLDFKRFENNEAKIGLSLEECDIVKITSETIDKFLPTVEAKGMKLDVSIPDSPLKGVTDKDALEKIISNLFSNAIKYGEKYIKIKLSSLNNYYIIDFENDGEVVDVADREQIFSRFIRLESDKNGAGVGLAYARTLAELLSGSLTMSDNLKVNHFVLKMPLNPKVQPWKAGSESETEAKPEPDTKLVPVKNDLIVPELNEGSVLIVEDNNEMSDFLKRMFEEKKFKVFVASNGEEAFKVLEEEVPDVVISDVMMPVMDGFELLEKIRNDEKISLLPVIMLTAKTSETEKIKGISGGADYYIEKPFSFEYVFGVVRTLLAKRNKMRQKYKSLIVTEQNPSGFNKVEEEFLMKINSIIKDNYMNPGFSMEDVIADLGMSRTTFYRRIRGLVSQNPNDYIKLYRLRRAVELFNEGHTSVSEVAYMVGFSSPGYFTKCFQKEAGISPKEYIAGLDN